MTSSIPIYKAYMPSLESVNPYLEKMHQSQIFSNNGPLVSELEARVAQTMGLLKENVCTVSNATLALMGAVQTSSIAKLRPKLELEIPSWTFSATVLAALQAGASVKFSDIDSQHRSLSYQSPNSIEVLPFGSGFRETSSFLIDGAASFDAALSAKHVLNDSQGLVISLHATKSLPAGEGGLFISRDGQWVNRMRSWCSFGFERGERQSSRLGLNAKMPEVSAAYALAALDQWPEHRRRLSKLRGTYLEECRRQNIEVAAPSAQELANPYFLIEMEPEEKSKFVNSLRSYGIETRDWWGKGAHAMPAFQDIPRGPMPVTNQKASTTVGIPFWAGIDAHDLFAAIEGAMREVRSKF